MLTSAGFTLKIRFQKLHSNKQVSGWIDFDKSVESDVKEIHKRLKIDLKISKENIAETILQHQN